MGCNSTHRGTERPEREEAVDPQSLARLQPLASRRRRTSSEKAGACASGGERNADADHLDRRRGRRAAGERAEELRLVIGCRKPFSAAGVRAAAEQKQAHVRPVAGRRLISSAPQDLAKDPLIVGERRRRSSAPCSCWERAALPDLELVGGRRCASSDA